MNQTKLIQQYNIIQTFSCFENDKRYLNRLKLLNLTYCSVNVLFRLQNILLFRFLYSSELNAFNLLNSQETTNAFLKCECECFRNYHK